MIVLVSGATRTPRSDQVGHLVVPRSWNEPRSLGLQPKCWAIDNGAFNGGFDAGAFIRTLKAFQPWASGCLFAAAPDVVADAASTRREWPFWSRQIRAAGYIPAFVAQDGLSFDQVPWEESIALFIGGTTRYKESTDARTLCAYAKTRGVWVHWGRVNGKRRFELAQMAGADSIDGTGFSIAPDINTRKAVHEWPIEIQQQPLLQETASS